ncbi:AGE family epimerase/isomerase, partial [Vibrio parahaemolyticus]
VEPGHQFEWSWLLNWHQRLNGGNYLEQREKLFRFGEHFGIDRSRKVAMDQVWNSGIRKHFSARLWRLCERVKAALGLGQKSTAD